MKKKSNRVATSFVVGLIFALGLGVSGMTQPQKVIGFLNVFAWDPSLVFVMAGSIAVHFWAYRLVRHRKSPLFDAHFHTPTRKDISPKLLVGSALFGFGWGLAGYCPGPAITSLGSGRPEILYFVVAFFLGMYGYRITEKYIWKS